MLSFLIFALISFRKAVGQVDPLSFVPSLSDSCSQSLSEFVLQLEPTSCGPNFSQMISDSNKFSVCTAGPPGTNCFDYGSLIGAGQNSNLVVPVFRLRNSTCSICAGSHGMSSGCQPLLQACTSAVYGASPDYSEFGITDKDEIILLDAMVKTVAENCITEQDKASVQVLEYQSQVLCAGGDTFGMSVSFAKNIFGIVDLRSLVQCGTCAVFPCLQGQLCDGSGEAGMCPAGYYCPTTAQKVDCPEGYFCPEGSIEPTKCRGIAAFSCGLNSEREVTWIPMFFALLIIVASVAGVICYDILYAKFQETNYLRIRHSNDSNEAKVATATIPVSISFENIMLVSGKTTRVCDVSGKIRPGKFTAILGGSGAGKTSLMNVILGREAKTCGKISYLSSEWDGNLPNHLLDRIVAFVPQNDVYLREMTVFELVQHSARWRLPSTLSREEINQRVEDVLTQLQLQSLRDVTVGGGLGGGNNNAKSSLSPGDRKLVNIALELVAGPNILFLDEPTTGIDSSSALNVAHIISELAKTGLTCVAVIHQPRAEIFSLIDDMIILVRGGKLAYQGPADYVLQYFAMHGYSVSNPKANKTDFLIDITSSPPKKNDENNEASETTWPELWEKEGEAFLQRMKNEVPFEIVAAATTNTNSSLGIYSFNRHSAGEFSMKDTANQLPLDVKRPGGLVQFVLFFYRGILQHFKHNIVLNDMIINFIGGTIMGIVTCGGPLLINAIPYGYTGNCPPGAENKCNSWIRFEIGPATFLMTMILGSITIPLAIRTFGREKEVFAREAAVGANKLAYFVGKSLSDVPFMAINTFIFMSPLIAIAPWRSPTDKLYGVLFCITLVVSSMGYFLAFSFKDPDTAVLTGVIFAVLINLFSGFVPTIGDGFVGLVVYSHWSARAITTTELWFGQGIDNVEDFNSIVPENWADPDLTYDCGIMVLISLILQIVSYLLLLYVNRRVAPKE